uniref:Heparan-sulfate 6-O-sulfotransferase n=1 Tax=Phlebotomus papatasi TaxID=29031 RepID=A0A1B0DHJ5_PHLPP
MISPLEDTHLVIAEVSKNDHSSNGQEDTDDHDGSLSGAGLHLLNLVESLRQQQRKVCALTKREIMMSSEVSALTSDSANAIGKTSQLNNPGLSYEEVLNDDDFQFDMNAHDVMVFLHIQKTGGTSFGKHLVRDLDLKMNIRKYISKLIDCIRGYHFELEQ